ncbi:fumarylacetoacetate hydrolase family protein [Herbiconiux daphne]|uniref:Fumarylacetoacetate hydrolase family protein n=1 Tax=Herbiconiux daphne TaxID=2970914 RepID=A0ABT2H3P3_9MICO|nr:fumarylacetoacetate hydrolase family protein [Herbiconiux daphne]MCS5734559.1 fumarylacetoacetate hydrolase family protein [Herbiconiux daphne]
MKLATLRTASGTVAVRVEADQAIEIAGCTDVGALLAQPDWRTVADTADGPTHPLAAIDDASWAPVVPSPSKIICVGLNYRNHILEMGRVLPEFPTLFSKYPEALIGAFDAIVVPEYASHALDWEAELAIVIGSPARRLDRDAAAAAIAGYSVINDITLRDYQGRTLEWLQGKTFDKTAPFGPVLVTSDEYGVDTEIRAEVDGEVMQRSDTGDLVFDPPTLVSYISHVLTLNPGDVIASGTPGGVGHARKPPRYLAHGSTVVTTIEGIGTLVNHVVVEEGPGGRED